MRLCALVPCMILAAAPVAALAQGKPAHTHEGFYLAFGASGASGDIKLDATGTDFSHMTIGGSGAQFDFRIGGAVAPNVILSFDLSTRAINSPSVNVDGYGGALSSDYTASDTIVGLGVTYYIMPSNVFISGTIGRGVFTMKNGGTSTNSESGSGIILRAGKEWWVSRNWGLGVAAGWARVKADDKSEPFNPGYHATLTTDRVFVGFSATFN